MAQYDSEWDKMLFAQKAGRERKHGFEGCKNYGKECDFTGFYLCRYSNEGLCSKCELKEFPERFHGCIFCRRPQKYTSDVCLSCDRGFKKWLKYQSNFSTKKYYDFSCLTFGLTHNLNTPQHRFDNTRYTFDFIDNSSTLSSKWPGFYVGDNKWCKPDISLEFEENLDKLNYEKIIYNTLKDNGIDIYQNIQYTPTKNDKLRSINDE